MADLGIIRDPRPEEMQGEEGFIPVATSKGTYKSESDKFKSKIALEAEKFSKLKKPFCARCAKLDYDKIKKDIIEAERTGYADFKKLGIKLPKLEEYGKEDRFEKVEEGETKNPGRWKGDPMTFDKWIKYKCKLRGCGITIFQ